MGQEENCEKNATRERFFRCARAINANVNEKRQILDQIFNQRIR